MTTNDADREWAKVAAVEAPRVVGGRYPYEALWNSILSKWPWPHRPASAVLVFWRGVAQEDTVHRDSPIGHVHDVSRRPDDRFRNKFTLSRSFSGSFSTDE